MSFPQAGTIGGKLIWLVILAVLPASLILLYTGLEQRREAVADARQEVLQLSRGLAEGQRDMVEAARQILSTLVVLPEIKARNLEVAAQILPAVLAANPDLLNIVLTDLEGTVLVAGASFAPVNLADRKHFREALEQRRFAVGEFIISRVGTAIPTFAVAQPVLDQEGRPLAMLAAAMRLNRLTRFLEATLLADGAFLALTDHQGVRLFYHPPDPETNLVGQPINPDNWAIASQTAASHHFLGQGSDGVRRVFAFEPVRLHPDSAPYAYAWAGIPATLVLAEANNALVRNLAWLTLAALLSFVVALLLGRNYFIRPLRDLVELTGRFAAGELSARTPSGSLPAEVTALTDSFHEMADSIRQGQQNLRDNEARFRLLMDSLDALVYVADMQTYEVLFINEFGKREFGDVTGSTCWRSLQKAQSGPCPFCTNAQLLAPEGKPGEVVAWEMQNSLNGKWFDVRDRAITWVDGRLVRLEIATDISTRKAAELHLADERERLAVTLRSIGDGVITTDIGGRVMLLNRVAEELTGWSSREATGRPLDEVFAIVDEHGVKPAANPVERVLSSGRISGLPRKTELLTRDGQRRSIADSAAPIRTRNSEIIGVILVFRDISEQLQTEQELAKIRKLEAVGVLAGGLAHDFNNILTAILGNIELAMLDRSLPADTRKLLEDAGAASRRARRLTAQLLTFAKGGEPIRETASLAEVIKDSAEFVLRGSKSACRYQIPPDLKLVDIDKGQISQVVQNLIINAAQAMPGGGLIRIECRNLEAAEAEALDLAGGVEYVQMSVLDHGTGIAPEIIDKIFDPYFTTKDMGSGLGLAISHSIVVKHGGRITVRSTKGVGTIISVYLPGALATAQSGSQLAAARVAAEQAGAGALLPVPVGPKARILVMDDELMIREVARVLLTKLGHEVRTVEEGGEAIKLYREGLAGSKPYDLVIMDLTIPGGMGGRETAAQIRALDPKAKMVVASGYSQDPVLADYRSYGFQAALVKPFDMGDLLRIIKELVG